MLDPIDGGTFWFCFGQLAKVVAEPIDTATVVARPESRLAHRHASHPRQRRVVVGGPRHHVNMGVDVVHGKLARDQML